MKSLSIILPGRLDSKRLPNKLILPFGKSCLWSIACEKLFQIKGFETAVLVRDEKLIRIAKSYGLKVIYRTKESIKVDGPLNLIFEGVKELSSSHVMWINPCLSLLKVSTILKAAEFFLKSESDYLESVKVFKNWLFDKEGNPLNEVDYEALNTKTIKPVFQGAHAFRIFKREDFLKDNIMLRPGHLVYPISDLEAVDVDTKYDYIIAGCVFEKTESR